MVEEEGDVQSLTIRYKSRKDAEMALAQGRHFPGANLAVGWHAPPGTKTAKVANNSKGGDHSHPAEGLEEEDLEMEEDRAGQGSAEENEEEEEEIENEV